MDTAAVNTLWSLRGVGAGYNEVEGKIAGIDLEICAGERIALLGGENSGRAFLFRVLAGLRPIRAGAMTLFGHEISVQPHYVDWDSILPWSVRRKMGVLLECEGLLSNVSVREGLETLFRFKNGDHTEKHREGARLMVQKIGDRFGLLGFLDRRPSALTQAERRLAGLARAFLSKPSAVLLENPTLGFGDLKRAKLEEVLSLIASGANSAVGASLGAASAAGRTMILSIEDLDVARRYCERWIVMEGESIVFDGPWKKFLELDDQVSETYRKALRFRDGGLAA